jgi:hypothetical protein
MPPSRAVIAAVLAFLVLAVPCRAAEEPSLREIISRLDTIMERLERLEQQLIRLEMRLTGPAVVDENGIIRDATGRPIGVWGIDVNPFTEELSPDVTPVR